MPELPQIRTVDSHVHVFDPARRRFPADAGYVPTREEARGVPDLVTELGKAGITHAVLVQPSAYGTDNRVLLSGLAAGNGRWRGVAVVAPTVRDDELVRLRMAGVVGLRINMQQSGSIFGGDLPSLAVLAARANAADLALHLQCFERDLPHVLPHLRAARRIFLDHLGFPDPRLPDRDLVRRLGDDARIWMKLSGAFRVSAEKAPFRDLDAHVANILTAFGPDRCVWGSDWPFINMMHRPAYAEALAVLEHWIPDEAQRRSVLSRSPCRAFFGDRAA